jgi:acyl-coenzyme A thioesterase PaaI-like protein
MLPVPAPECITATGVLLKRGRKAATSRVDLTAPDGTLVAMGAAGFTTVPRRESDPVKPVIDLERLVKIFGIHPGLSHPLRDEAGIDVIDAATGVVELAVRPEVRNPNGTLQGAMVALIAEAAVEDLLTARHGEPFVVTDLDVRYLGRAENGPVRSSCRVLGDAVEVTLTDTSTGGITTLVYARAARSSL